MPAYLIVEHRIADPDKFQECSGTVRPMIANYGGRLLTKGGTHKVLETDHFLPDRVAVFEFPDMTTLNTWYSSPQYKPLLKLRQSATDMSKDVMIAIDGA
ncbi:uncharacterized protein (DUF1330 family) [Rhizobium sp. BK313]|uniref:DUF1330 domain-containing protein n=1 Tax=Rhizobium sp. BK313 TaxID=2587081 RepID=UPI0010D75542|nr:DUF1330 domain-containing protein [Rhizobium sp. BK313]MBB3456258.1 uncharacterized protein (DUF1330 family) [Rhizobium sp. BK313]